MGPVFPNFGKIFPNFFLLWLAESQNFYFAKGFVLAKSKFWLSGSQSKKIPEKSSQHLRKWAPLT